ncbi:MAG: hypothetical protein HY554_14645 [Elusimicrobia bacterium]|nr:hypothetical protein [Elusimicrobiota bacterium]
MRKVLLSSMLTALAMQWVAVGPAGAAEAEGDSQYRIAVRCFRDKASERLAVLTSMVLIQLPDQTFQVRAAYNDDIARPIFRWKVLAANLACRFASSDHRIFSCANPTGMGNDAYNKASMVLRAETALGREAGAAESTETTWRFQAKSAMRLGDYPDDTRQEWYSLDGCRAL